MAAVTEPLMTSPCPGEDGTSFTGKQREPGSLGHLPWSHSTRTRLAFMPQQSTQAANQQAPLNINFQEQAAGSEPISNSESSLRLGRAGAVLHQSVSLDYNQVSHTPLLTGDFLKTLRPSGDSFSG